MYVKLLFRWKIKIKNSNVFSEILKAIGPERTLNYCPPLLLRSWPNGVPRMGDGRSQSGPKFLRLPHGFLDGSSARSPTGLALLRPSLSAQINEVPRGDLPGPPSNSAASGLAHANSSFLIFPAVVVVGVLAVGRELVLPGGRAPLCPAALDGAPWLGPHAPLAGTQPRVIVRSPINHAYCRPVGIL